MTNEQINRAAAEELGYSVHPDDSYGFLTYHLCSLDEGPVQGAKTEEGAWLKAPDFCTDHNAAAEIRRAIRSDEQVKFAFVLERILSPAVGTFDLINASPRQQAEAFLRMRGKWRE